VPTEAVIKSVALPVDMGEHDQQILKQYGVKFNGLVEGDEMFENVELPDGWCVVETDKPEWFSLDDDEGNSRAVIYYSTSYYKRYAWLRTSRRFDIVPDYDFEDENPEVRVCVTDYGVTAFTTKEYLYDPSSIEQFEAVKDAAHKEALGWLEENYPQWKSHLAYRE
jgi:hypothetical protein